MKPIRVYNDNEFIKTLKKMKKNKVIIFDERPYFFANNKQLKEEERNDYNMD